MGIFFRGNERRIRSVRMAFFGRILWDSLCYVELLLSTVVHAVYALHLFFSAMWIDFMNATFTSTTPRLISSRIAPVIEPAEGRGNKASFYSVKTEATDLSLAGAFLEDHQKAPIVLVHGIFGFGKEVSVKVLLIFASLCINFPGISRDSFE